MPYVGNTELLFGAAGGAATVTFETGETVPAVAAVYRISGFAGNIGSDVRSVLDSSRQITDMPNPPGPSSAPWGVDTNLFLTFCCAVDDDATFVSAPTNYTDLTQVVSGAGLNAGCEIGVAERDLEADTDDPGPFTLSETEGSFCGTMILEPGGATYPVVEERLTQGFSTPATSFDVDLPASIGSGDLVIVFFHTFSINGGMTISTPAGFDSITTNAGTSNFEQLRIVGKVCP